MNKKSILVLLVVLVVIVIVIIALTGGDENNLINDNNNEQVENLGSVTDTYDPTLPDEDLELTEAKTETKAAPNSEASLRVFDISATEDGYSINNIVVNKGDTISLNLIGSEGAFDVSLPDLGLYQMVEDGGEKKIEFQALTPGTFSYICQSSCPGGKNIKGSLVVKNK
jgi:heme/copper-type cytochrome/quinol oxidase subunit 2